MRDPFESLLQKVLPDGRTVDKVFAEAVGAAVVFGKVSLRIADEGSGIDGVVDFLVVERLPRDVDGFEPLQFF